MPLHTTPPACPQNCLACILDNAGQLKCSQCLPAFNLNDAKDQCRGSQYIMFSVLCRVHHIHSPLYTYTINIHRNIVG